jgi:tetratricopeptide (TPR) repeat protein
VAKSTIKNELKRPDEFVSFWTKLGDAAARFAQERKRALSIGATALVTVLIGSVIVSQVSERKATTATDELLKVEKIATAELIPESGAAPSDGVPHFKTDKERAEAALKELDGFLAGAPRNPLRQEAVLERGPLLLQLGRAPEAASAYQGLLADKLDDRLRFLAHEGLGYALEAKGDLDGAAAAFGKLADDATAFQDGSFYKDRAGYHKARIAELRGNRNDAAKLYREVLDKNPTTSLRDEITNRLAVLELK